MAETERKYGSRNQSLDVLIVNKTTAQPVENLVYNSPSLALWYRRDGEEIQPLTLVELANAAAAHQDGGFCEIDDGYYRVDLPDDAFLVGAEGFRLGGSMDDNVVIGMYVRLSAQCTTARATGGGVSWGDVQTVACDAILPEAPQATHEGCIVATKRRHIPVPQGLCGQAVWIMRQKNGNALDLSSCLEDVDPDASVSVEADVNSVKVRFRGCDRAEPLYQVTGSVLDAASGMVQFPVSPICKFPGIFEFQVAIVDPDGDPLIVDGGLISVEPGLWGHTSISGPPTIQEIRLHLRDTGAENDLLGDYEFDDAEILESIRRPVMHFNEMPPTLRQYNCMNFPWRYQWLNATVAELLRTAAHHYVRNKMQASGSGLSVDDKNKNDDYLRIAKMYRDEWLEFIRLKKASLNMGGFAGSY